MHHALSFWHLSCSRHWHFWAGLHRTCGLCQSTLQPCSISSFAFSQVLNSLWPLKSVSLVNTFICLVGWFKKHKSLNFNGLCRFSHSNTLQKLPRKVSSQSVKSQYCPWVPINLVPPIVRVKYFLWRIWGLLASFERPDWVASKNANFFVLSCIQSEKMPKNCLKMAV